MPDLSHGVFVFGVFEALSPFRDRFGLLQVRARLMLLIEAEYRYDV
jgi:hypothetical protein